MVNIINFPSLKSVKKSSNCSYDSSFKETTNSIKNLSFFYHKSSHYIQGYIPTVKESRAFLELVKKWPCFKFLDPSVDFEKLLEIYYEDNLTASQDCVIEYLFHINDSSSSFDMLGSLHVWDQDDRNFFILSINLHIELIEQIKNNKL